MSDKLYALMEAGRLSPLSYYFARFVARGSGVEEDKDRKSNRSCPIIPLSRHHIKCREWTRNAPGLEEKRGWQDPSGSFEEGGAFTWPEAFA
jgi:hypothetical protein